MKVEDIERGFAGALASLHKHSDVYSLHCANQLYAQQDYRLLDEFLTVVKDIYKCEVLSVDFQGNVEGVRREINDWVAEATKQKMCDLIGLGVLNAATGLVLVNAVYFKGSLKGFAIDVVRCTFYTSRQVEIQVIILAKHYLVLCP